jgi:hypothetical protein
MTMRSVLIGVALLVLTDSAHAQSSWQQQCGKGEMPTPNGCTRVCPPGDYHIGKDASGYQTCLRDGNSTVREAIVGTGAITTTRQKKYAFLPIAAGNDVDGICFGIRSDERVETVNDDRLVEGEWHVHTDHVYVAEISYTLTPDLTKLHLTAFRYWHLDANQKPTPGDALTADATVPLYDAPQANWPCTKQQWATIMTPPEKLLLPPPGAGGGSGVHIKRMIYEPGNGHDCMFSHEIGCGHWEYK